MRIGKNREEMDTSPQYVNDTADRFFDAVFGEKTRKQKTLLSAAAALLFLIFAYCAGFFVAVQDSAKTGVGLVYTLGDMTLLDFYAKALFTPRGWLFIALLFGALLAILYIIKHRHSDLNQIKASDERGVDFAEKGTYGTAEWMSRADAEKTYEIGHIDDVKGAVLGQYSSGGRETICLPVVDGKNNNVLILGSPGTGKSYCYVRNAIFQAILRNESIVITDPKGELYMSTSEKLRQCGYKVKVFNLVDPQRSDSWDCLQEIFNPRTGYTDDIRVMEFADALMKNTTEGPDDHFWGTGEANLLKAIIMYCAWNREMNLKALYEMMGRQLCGEIADRIGKEYMEASLNILTDKTRSVSMYEREKTVWTLAKMARSEEKADEIIKDIHRKAPPCNIASIYHMIVSCDLRGLEEKFKAVPISHPAGIAWSSFKNGSDNVKPGIIQGLAQRLQLFQMEDIRRITINDDIRLEDISKEKTALFCIISDKSTAMKPLTSLFFSFLFKDIADAADRYQPENRLAVNVICDEFANLGIISQFDVTISTVRSRKINISIILQSVMQLEKNYAEAGETIISCCDTILFLGCNDTATAEFISELSGVASIRVLSTRDSKSTSLGTRGMMQGYAVSEGDGKRNLLNPDEVRRLPKEDVIIYHNGCNILQAHRCGYDNHRFFREGMPAPTRLSDYPLATEKYSDMEGMDSFLQGDISNMAQRNFAILEKDKIDSAVNAIKKEPPKQEPEMSWVAGAEKDFDF